MLAWATPFLGVFGAYTLTAIARALDLSVSRVSRLVAAYEAKGKTCAFDLAERISPLTTLPSSEPA
jgi:DNA-binding MarR family transcriptional regulator